MPVKLMNLDPQIVVMHAGVTIYRCYEDNEFDKPCRYIFTIDKDHTDESDPCAFSVKEMSPRFISEEPKSTQAAADDLNMTPDEFRRSPHWVTHMEEWDQWKIEKEPALIISVLREAIEKGTLPA